MLFNNIYMIHIMTHKKIACKSSYQIVNFFKKIQTTKKKKK